MIELRDNKKIVNELLRLFKKKEPEMYRKNAYTLEILYYTDGDYELRIFSKLQYSEVSITYITGNGNYVYSKTVEEVL